MNNNTYDEVEKKLSDKAFRAELRKNHQLVSEIGYDYDENIQYIIKTNARNKIYLPIIDSQHPEKVNLDQIQAAGSIASAGSAGTASTYGSVCTTVGSAACLSTAGSAGG